MTMGHFATALVPWSKLERAPAWLLLVCAQLLDFVCARLGHGGGGSVAPANPDGIR